MGQVAFVHHSAKFGYPMMIAAALACGLGLAGCVEDTAQAPAAASAPSEDNIARRPNVSPAAATVEVASVSGAPANLDDRYEAMLAAFAKQNAVSIIDSGKADYALRAYLSAEADNGGATIVSYVLDVFDAGKHRTQRVTDQITLRGQAPDPWSLVSDDILASLAQKSASALAAVMTNTPEAIAASSTPGSATQSAASAPPAQDSGQTAVAATPPSAPAPPTAATQPGNGYGMTAQR